MLESVITAVVSALSEAGLSAGPAFPGKAVDRERGSFVRVGIRKATDKSAGFDRYLGYRSDPETGEREVYGLRCDIALSLDIYAPLSAENAALECLRLFDRAAAAAGGIPGLHVRELSCGAPGPDRETGMLRLSGGVMCAGLLTATGGGDGSAFTDFVLRGELQA